MIFIVLVSPQYYGRIIDNSFRFEKVFFFKSVPITFMILMFHQSVYNFKRQIKENKIASPYFTMFKENGLYHSNRKRNSQGKTIFKRFPLDR